jgi:hypothetical protein
VESGVKHHNPNQLFPERERERERERDIRHVSKHV